MPDSVLLQGMWAMPIGWKLWLAWMMSINAAAAIAFSKHREAKLILAAFIGGGIIMSAIASSLGFVRLLGLGHVLWIPLMPYLVTRVRAGNAQGPYLFFLKAVLVTNCLSLILDFADVTRYLLGERAPYIVW